MDLETTVWLLCISLCGLSCWVVSNSSVTSRTAALLCPWDSQARLLEQVAISFSRGSPQPRDRTQSPAPAGEFFTTEPPGKPLHYNSPSSFILLASELPRDFRLWHFLRFSGWVSLLLGLNVRCALFLLNQLPASLLHSPKNVQFPVCYYHFSLSLCPCGTSLFKFNYSLYSAFWEGSRDKHHVNMACLMEAWLYHCWKHLFSGVCFIFL